MRDRLSAVLAASGVIALLAGFMVISTSGTAQANHQGEDVSKWVFVCKYVKAPGPDEVVQPSSNNPISVSVHALTGKDDPPEIGAEFSDGQGLSVVVAFDESKGDGQQNEPSLDCPALTGSTSVTPLPFTATAATCPQDGRLVAPSAVTGVNVSVSPAASTGPGTYTITYTPDEDITLVVPDGSPITIDSTTGIGTQTITVPGRTGPPCDSAPTVVSPAVSFVNPSCPSPGGSAIRGATDTEGIDFTVSGTPGPGQTVTVTAVAKKGFAFPAGTTTEWTHTFLTLEELACDTGPTLVSPAGVSFVNPTCPSPGRCQAG